MGYRLGVDLGTTFTAAAIAGADGRTRMVALGDHGTAVPSVLLLGRDGAFLVGDAAVRRATDDPDRVARETKRRVGDAVPVMLGGSPYSAALLQARLLRWVLDRVSSEQGSAPAGVAVTHPASWGPYKLEELRSALRQVDVEVATLLPEPVAAATAYAAERELAPGATVAVYDLGGGTFDCCVVRRGQGSGAFEIIGTPEGVDRLGGVDFDEAVFDHVRRSLGGVLDGLDPDDPATVAGLAHLRRECTAAKEALSADTTATISVLLPSVATTVRLGRAEFEGMIRPALSETITALRRTIRTAGLGPEDLDAVLLVGGSSRIPQVSQLVAAELGRPVAVDAHPKDAIALGAALAVAAAGGDVAAPAAPPAVPPWTPAPTDPAPAAPPVGGASAATEAVGEPVVPPVVAASVDLPAGPPRAAAPPGGAGDPAGSTTPATGEPPRGGGRRRPSTKVLAIATVLALVAVVTGVLALSGGGGDDDPTDDFAREGSSSEVDTTDLDEEAIEPSSGNAVVRSISVPDSTLLVIRADSPDDLVVSVLGDDTAAETLTVGSDAISAVDEGVSGEFFGTSSITDVTDRDLVDDEVEAGLPQVLLAASDDVSTGEEEVLFLAFPRGAEVVVLFTVFDGSAETTVDARIDLLQYSLDDLDDAQAFVDAVRGDSNVEELLPELADL